jgi:hypothetical protein
MSPLEISNDVKQFMIPEDHRGNPSGSCSLLLQRQKHANNLDVIRAIIEHITELNKNCAVPNPVQLMVDDICELKKKHCLIKIPMEVPNSNDPPRVHARKYKRRKNDKQRQDRALPASNAH